MGWIVKLNGKGRIVIPREVRGKLGLSKGDSLVLDIRGGEIVLTILREKKAENSGKEHLKSFLSEH